MSTPTPRTGPALPPPREPRPAGDAYAVAVVCLGNICRSPTAHVVLEAALHEAGIGDRVTVSSGGTGGWHVGGPMDSRAAATLRRAGYDPSAQRAEQVDAGWFARHDLVLAMDRSNLADLRRLAASAEQQGVVVGPDRLRLFLDFDPDAVAAAAAAAGGGQDGDGTSGPEERDVPDPYYGGDDGFAHVLTLVQRTSDALAAAVAELLGR